MVIGVSFGQSSDFVNASLLSQSRRMSVPRRCIADADDNLDFQCEAVYKKVKSEAI
jgi:hypothetical protein